MACAVGVALRWAGGEPAPRVRRAVSRTHAALLPKLQSNLQTCQNRKDPGDRRKAKPLRVGCPDWRRALFQSEAAPATLSRLKRCDYPPPVLPGLGPDTEWTPPHECEHPEGSGHPEPRKASGHTLLLAGPSPANTSPGKEKKTLRALRFSGESPIRELPVL